MTTQAPTRASLGGTRPAGAQDEAGASRQVREMFSRIAPRYDFLNHALSLRFDVVWRKRVAKRFRALLRRPGARVLDLCCGTGDVMIAMGVRAEASIYGSDFCHPMLTAAQSKAVRKGVRPLLFEADGLALPLPDRSLDLITTAFGFRNFVSYRRGLEEMVRVLRPGGTAAILEFTPPPKTTFGKLYRIYCTKILPKLGAIISGDREAYEYLPHSVRKFPEPEELADEMRNAGFNDVRYELMTFRTVALHLGRVR